MVHNEIMTIEYMTKNFKTSECVYQELDNEHTKMFLFSFYSI